MALTQRPEPRPELLAIQAYVPGKSTVVGTKRLHKLSSNESPLGPSPLAIAAFREAAGELALYPDGATQALRNAIARRYGLEPERILCGNGSDEILGLLAQAYLRPGDEGLYSQYGFLSYPIAIRAAGGEPVIAPETDFTASVDNLLERVHSRTRIVFLANPNNPTGTYLPQREITRLHAGLPSRVLLVLDAAYAEYMRAQDYTAGLELAASQPNVVMTRTFSKIHGLANLRLGWAYAPRETVDVIGRIRGPFNVNGPAQAAGIAALEDDAHVEMAALHNDCWLAWLTAEIGKLGLYVVPSVGNFVLIRFDASGRCTAPEAEAFLNREGFIPRGVAGYGLPECLRVTVGDEEANRGFVETLGRFMREVGRAQ